MLKHKLPGMLAVNPEGGKVARASAVSPVMESGNVYLPHPHLYKWVNDIIEQCAAFPNGANDDIVDMISQALNRLMYNYIKRIDRTPPGKFYTQGELEDLGYKKLEIRKVK
jgi:phage terminase large subunit-like protein